MTTTPSSPFSEPKMGLNIAEFIANFNIFEFALYQALADMLDDPDGKLTEALLSQVDSVAYKMSVVYDVARVKQDSKASAKAVLTAETEIRRLTRFRNMLAHGLYVTKDNGEFGIVSNVFRVGRKKVEGQPLVRQEIVDNCRALIAINHTISEATAHKGISLQGGGVTITPRVEHG